MGVLAHKVSVGLRSQKLMCKLHLLYMYGACSQHMYSRRPLLDVHELLCVCMHRVGVAKKVLHHNRHPLLSVNYTVGVSACTCRWAYRLQTNAHASPISNTVPNVSTADTLCLMCTSYRAFACTSSRCGKESSSTIAVCCSGLLV